MNRYIDDAERAYAVRTLAAGPMRVADVLNFLPGRSVYLLAQARGLGTSGMTKPNMAQRLVNDIIEQGEDKPLPDELQPRQPPPDTGGEQEIDPDAPKCECPDVMKDARSMLRWQKADQGQPVTVSYDLNGAPEMITAQNIDGLFGMIASVCGINFQKMPAGQKGDVHISFVDLTKRKTEGGAQILGFAYQPSSGEKMSAAGDLSGDIFCDNSGKFMTELWEMLIKLLHEIMHAIGCHHTNVPRDIMYGRPTAAGNRTLSAGDIKQLTDRYGAPQQAAA